MRQTVSRIADLAKIDGGLIDRVFQQELARVTEDVIDRPGLETPRKLEISISLAPVMGQSGVLDTVKVCCEVAAKVPKQKSQGYSMLCGKGSLTFNDNSRDDVHQRTLDELHEEEDENKS